jgi:hypothetical protein
MASRDGQTFRRYTDAVIPTTAPQDRDGNRSNYMAWGVHELKPGELSVYAKEAYYAGVGSRLRRFVYRVDGFVALHAGDEGGEVVTRPLTFKGSKLVLNYRAADKGSVGVEIMYGDGTPGIRATGLDGDHASSTVVWDKDADAIVFAGKPVRLRFTLKNADLFSFRFE